MTPQEQVAAILEVCRLAAPGPRGRIKHSAVSAAAIRAAVDLVLPEEAGPELNDPRGAIRDYQRLSRQDARAQFLAIAAELEGPANG